jgi:glycosyltransferase involved in cell wall biosynthesis
LGDRLGFEIALMDYRQLKGYKGTLHFVPLFGRYFLQKGAFRLALKSYDQYMLTGEMHSLSSWLVLLICRLRGKKAYIWSHGIYGNESRTNRFIKKVYYHLASKVLLYGDYARDFMIERGFAPERLICVYNSLDYENQAHIRNELKDSNIYPEHFGNTDPVLLFIGRIQKIKKIDLLLEALKGLHDRHIACNLMLIGKEIEQTGIREMAENLKLGDRIWFYGQSYEEEEIAGLIYQANVCVSPGNVGLTAIHCLSYGTPVITHDNFARQMPEFESIESKISGDFFKEDSVEDLQNVIQFWLEKTSRDRDAVRKACYTIIEERYNPSRQMEIFRNIL